MLRANNLFCLISAAVLLILASNVQAVKIDVRESMVKIYSVQNSPDYNNPWNMTGPVAVSGSGCIIRDNLILTNAHVISDHTFIQVRLHGKSKKYEAQVVAVSHEADLALMTVTNKEFFKGAAALQFGTFPEVQEEAVVYGFPEGGDTLSITKGVISRTEHIYYAHSLIELLATQLDAAVNPGNSGGPVMIDDRIVGVVMGTRRDSDNIGYMIPAPIIEHFLTDIADGIYDGFPDDGIILQNMENEGLKRMYGFKKGHTGALIRAIIQEFVNDRIVEVDGKKILNLVELITIIESKTEDPFIVLKTESGRTIALDREVAEKEHRNILQSYRIVSDRSADLKMAAGNCDAGDSQRAEIIPPDKNSVTLK